MKTLVTIERPALWRPIRNDEMSVRSYSNYPYKDKSVYVGASSPVQPVIRYAKNFTKSGLKFSLFMFSNESDIAKVELFFAEVVKSLKKTQISECIASANMTSFNYLDTYYGGNN